MLLHGGLIGAAGWVAADSALPFHADVGAYHIAGTYNFSSPNHTIQAAGYDLYAAADSVHFAYKTLNGDGTLVARVISIGGDYSDNLTGAGVMIRESLATDSITMIARLTKASGLDYLYRASNGGSIVQVGGPAVAPPYWVKMVRSGNNFSVYQSSDGASWTQVGATQTIGMSSTAYAGIWINGHYTSFMCTAIMDSVSIP